MLRATGETHVALLGTQVGAPLRPPALRRPASPRPQSLSRVASCFRALQGRDGRFQYREKGKGRYRDHLPDLLVAEARQAASPAASPAEPPPIISFRSRACVFTAVHPSSNSPSTPPPRTDNGLRAHSIYAVLRQQSLCNSINSRVCCGARAVRIHWLRSWRSPNGHARSPHAKQRRLPRIAGVPVRLSPCVERPLLPLRVNHHGAPLRQQLCPHNRCGSFSSRRSLRILRRCARLFGSMRCL